MDVSRTIANSDNSTIELNSSEELRVKDSGITTAKLADSSVTYAKVGTFNLVESGASGVFSTSSTSFVDVTNLSLNITTNGHPVVIMLRPTHASSVSAWSYVGTNSSELKLLRDSNMIGGASLFGDGSGVATAWASTFIDTSLAAGTYNYKIQIRCVTSGSLLFGHYTLVAYE